MQRRMIIDRSRRLLLWLSLCLALAVPSVARAQAQPAFPAAAVLQTANLRASPSTTGARVGLPDQGQHQQRRADFPLARAAGLLQDGDRRQHGRAVVLFGGGVGGGRVAGGDAVRGKGEQSF